jgi:hypothetical protein
MTIQQSAVGMESSVLTSRRVPTRPILISDESQFVRLCQAERKCLAGFVPIQIAGGQDMDFTKSGSRPLQQHKHENAAHRFGKRGKANAGALGGRLCYSHCLTETSVRVANRDAAWPWYHHLAL